MSIITDLKDSIRNAVNAKDDTINFNFNEIQVAEYPYIFFYIPSYKLDKAIDSEYWRKLTLMCVVEYAKSENNNQIELWQYSDTLTEMLKLFDFLDTKISAKNQELKTVDDVLQMTFDLEFYVKILPGEDEENFMREIEMTLKEKSESEININYMEEL